MRHGTGLTWAQVLMAANTPVLLRAAMVDGHPEAGLMPSGQVAGLIEDLPSCAELIGRIMTEAEQRLAGLAGLTAASANRREVSRISRSGPAGGQTRSMIVTFAWPPPSHMVTIPYRPPVRASE